MRKLSLLLFLALMSGIACGQTPPAPAGPGNDSESPLTSLAGARAELETMFETDQTLRREIMELEKKHGRDSAQVRESWERQTAIDVHNIGRLEEIIARHGWPDRARFGHKAANAAFLVLQHAGLEHQKKYLPLVRDAAAKGELEGSLMALLEDRVRVREGMKQIYGSQVARNEAGEWEPLPIEDETTVDIMRAHVGLGPLAEYLQGFADRSGGRVSPKWVGAAKSPSASSSSSPPSTVTPAAE